MQQIYSFALSKGIALAHLLFYHCQPGGGDEHGDSKRNIR